MVFDPRCKFVDGLPYLWLGDVGDDGDLHGCASQIQKTIAAEDDRGHDGTGQVCLGLLPFGPDPVHSQPLHRTRPSSAATDRSLVHANLTPPVRDLPAGSGAALRSAPA